ncbi:siderophore-interacting protein [Amycolatopsis suaedae]|uniref:Siderophore-interacting protein n=1 Tax=Amycolatopsis suaedae TaxID=2510978 RepID=A0A4Q7JDJ0_9PSEU|nr:siderophore-interacting protein [Amycolatopsis suaedae]RZQ65960.1 siderophore-interacting protein [Amycolatopsis suaedae]
MLPRIKSPESRKMVTLEVVTSHRTSPGFLTVTLGGPQLRDFTPMGYDQIVRLFFPRPGQTGLRMPTLSNEAWMAELMLLPKSRRPWVRNFTIRRARPDRDEVDIEFALHADSPASTWALAARPGDPAGIFDMGVSYLPPAHARWQLLAGDETALPAILAILEHAPPDLTAEVYLEVPGTADIRDVDAPAGARVHWLPRDEPGRLPGTLALDTLRQLTPREGRFYTWVAGESRLATGLRRHLTGEHGVPKSDIAFFGYWRHGRASPG